MSRSPQLILQRCSIGDLDRPRDHRPQFPAVFTTSSNSLPHLQQLIGGDGGHLVKVDIGQTTDGATDGAVGEEEPAAWWRKLPLRLGLPAHRPVPGIWCGHPTLDWLVVDADRHGGPDGVSAFDALVRRARERASGWATHDDRPSRRLIDWSLRQSRWQSTGRLCCRKVPMVMA